MAAKKTTAPVLKEYFVREDGVSDGAEIQASSPTQAVEAALDQDLVLLADRYHVYELVGSVRRAVTFTEEE